MPALSSLALAGGGLLGSLSGGIAGGSDKRTRQDIEVSDPGEFERMLRQQQGSLFSDLQALGQASGLGAADVQRATQSQRDVADILQQLQQTSGLPTKGDIRSSQDLTAALFAPQREALRQSFQDQRVEANRQAAISGRGINDPILRNKLAQDQTRQSALLEATQGAQAQQLAFALPTQRLQFAGQRADILGGLANQAFQNKSSLLQIGNQLAQQERDFRLNTATRTNVQEGSLGQALAGGFAGLGQGLSAGASFGSLFGGGGGIGNATGNPSFTSRDVASFQPVSAPSFLSGPQIFPSSSTGGFNNGIFGLMQNQTGTVNVGPMIQPGERGPGILSGVGQRNL